MKFTRRNFLQALAAAAAGALLPKAEKVEADEPKPTIYDCVVKPFDCEFCTLEGYERAGCCGMKNYAEGFDIPSDWYKAARHGAINDDGTIEGIDLDAAYFDYACAPADRDCQHRASCDGLACIPKDVPQIYHARSSEPEPVSEHTSDGWPVSDANVFVIRPGNEWLPFDSIGDAVDFVGERGTPSEQADVVYVLPGDGTVDET